jgi:3-methyl-2-oxobutanoate hydroxymethyltransferase
MGVDPEEGGDPWMSDPADRRRREAMSTRPEETTPAPVPRTKTTVLTFADKHRRGEPITMLTAYDYPTARIVDEAGIDAILVGDSLAMVVLGHPNTLSVTMEEMLHHARAVSRGARNALLIGDMPFMSYQADAPEAVRNAGRFVQAGMDAVKLEGGRSYVDTVRAIVRAGIPVQGHVGLTPQSLSALGGWRVQGRTAEAARQIMEDALALEDAGCFSIVLEGLPSKLAAHITARVRIPTIGIGAGVGTSGQVLVIHDVLGLYDKLTPKFAKRYADLAASMGEAVAAYKSEVERRAFPDRAHSYAIPEAEWEAFLASDKRLRAAGGRGKGR